MAKYVLTVTSKSGRQINKLGRSSTDSVAVYDDADLKRRLDTAAENPDLEVEIRKLNER